MRKEYLLVIMAMFKVNPKRNTSHKTCGWVVENFIDLVQILNPKLKGPNIGEAWFKLNQGIEWLKIQKLIERINRS
jgi:hypothetical protein